MLLDPDTLELSERAPEVLGRLAGDRRFKLELPASQIELVTAPHGDVPAAMRELADARRTLLDAADGLVRPAAAAVHPFSPEEGRLNDGPRYERTEAEYGRIARRQLVSALQVHVAVGGAERTLAVYNALREHLPELAALAANGPFQAGQRHRARLDPPEDLGGPAPPGHPAGARELGGAGRGAALGRRGGRPAGDRRSGGGSSGRT